MKKIFRKLTKTFIIIVICFIVFVVLAVIFVHRDETGKITISFKSSTNKISDNGFNRIIDEKSMLAKISEVNWSETIKEVMDKNKTAIAKQGIVSKTFASDPEVQKKLTDYFIKSSQIELPEDPMLTLRAFTDFQRGSSNKLDELISQYQKGYEELKKINYPKEANVFHENSTDILEKWIALLTNLKNKKITIEEFLNSNELKIINDMTKQTVSIFKDLINRYNLNLPESVF